MAGTSTEASIWEHVIHPKGELRHREVARSILQLSFSPEERIRMHELAVRNQDGSLTVEEESELDHYNRVGTLLSIMKSKARKLLKNGRRAARKA
jgi:hypothetical protein